jgi:hypothetical protein
MIMSVKSAKVLTAVLVLASTSLTFVSNVSARPYQRGWQVGGESYTQERHDPTNTNEG